MVRDPGDYRWSSYCAHAFGAPAQFWTAHDLYLAQCENPADRQKTWRKRVGEALDVLSFFYLTLAPDSDPIYSARGMLGEMRQAADQGMPVPPIAFAIMHTGLGEIDTALEYFGDVLKQRSWHILLLHADSAFEKVRARPEGLALLREAGLPA